MSSLPTGTKRGRASPAVPILATAQPLPLPRSASSSPGTDLTIAPLSGPAWPRKRARQSTYDDRVAAAPSASTAVWHSSSHEQPDLASLLTADMDTLTSERSDRSISSGAAPSLLHESVHDVPSTVAVQPPARTSNKSGHRGIRVRHLRDGSVKYDAMLCTGGSSVKFLGAFDSLEMAIAEYDLARAALRPVTTRGTSPLSLTEQSDLLQDDALFRGDDASLDELGDEGPLHAEVNVAPPALAAPAPAPRAVGTQPVARNTLKHPTAAQKRREAVSRYRGVRASTLARGGMSYRAIIKAGPQRRTIGTFSTAEEAARAYDAEARLHFGKGAKLNFPHERAPPTAAIQPVKPLAFASEDVAVDAAIEQPHEQLKGPAFPQNSVTLPAAAPQAAAAPPHVAPYDASYIRAHVASALHVAAAASTARALLGDTFTTTGSTMMAPSGSMRLVTSLTQLAHSPVCEMSDAMPAPAPEERGRGPGRDEDAAGAGSSVWQEHDMGAFELYGATREGILDGLASSVENRSQQTLPGAMDDAPFSFYGTFLES